jgi:hypothetical protein
MCTNTPGSFVCECRAEFIKDGASGKCIPFVKSESSGAAANDEVAGEVQPGQQANPADGIATEGADDPMAADGSAQHEEL